MPRTFKNTVPNDQVILFIITYARKEETYLEMQKQSHHFIQTVLSLCYSSDSNKQFTVNHPFSDLSKDNTKEME